LKVLISEALVAALHAVVINDILLRNRDLDMVQRAAAIHLRRFTELRRRAKLDHRIARIRRFP
jgi:hypothetical protein